MTTRKIVMAGFGGQGVMAMGQLISYAGMLEGKHVSWYPSYGPEMRGGAANCSVVVSTDPVGSPIIAVADDVVVMNEPSLELFESHVKPGGNLLLNSSLVQSEPTRKDINIYKIPVNDIAGQIGNPRVANMVMLGAYLKVTGLVEKDSIIAAFTKVYGDKKKKLIPINEKAIGEGQNAVGSPQASNLEGKVNRTPEQNYSLRGGENPQEISYINDIRKMDKEDEEKIFSSELNIVKQALLNEIEGINYFKVSASQFSGQETAKIFESLAHQADEHVEYLMRLKDQIEKHEAGIFDKIKPALETQKEEEWSKIKAERTPMALSIFNLGMTIKRNNIEFYEKASEKSAIEDAKKLYKELAYWENFQLGQLKEQYEMLKREWWSDQSFAPY